MLMQSIDSILKQTYQNMEIIVIDDNGLGSEYQKKNEEVFQKYPQIRYVPNTVNSGAQFSRNHGILLSRGDYVAFLDDDDLWAETKIEKQISMFTMPDIAMVFFPDQYDGGADRAEKVSREHDQRKPEILHDRRLPRFRVKKVQISELILSNCRALVNGHIRDIGK